MRATSATHRKRRGAPRSGQPTHSYVSRTGEEPEKSPETTRGLDTLASQDPVVRTLVGRYFSRQAQLHGLCFYYGWCEPLSETETAHTRDHQLHRRRGTTRGQLMTCHDAALPL